MRESKPIRSEVLLSRESMCMRSTVSYARVRAASPARESTVFRSGDVGEVWSITNDRNHVVRSPVSQREKERECHQYYKWERACSLDHQYHRWEYVVQVSRFTTRESASHSGQQYHKRERDHGVQMRYHKREREHIVKVNSITTRGS